MKKYYRVIYSLLLVSFMSVDAVSQVRIDSIGVDVLAEMRQNRLEEEKSATVCNPSWLREATAQDVDTELRRFDNDTFDYFFPSGLHHFIRSNDPCDFETGDRPLDIAEDAGASPAVISALMDFGAESYPINNGIIPENTLNNSPYPTPTYVIDNNIDTRSRLRELNKRSGCFSKETVVGRNGTTFCR